MPRYRGESGPSVQSSRCRHSGHLRTKMAYQARQQRIPRILHPKPPAPQEATTCQAFHSYSLIRGDILWLTRNTPHRHRHLRSLKLQSSPERSRLAIKVATHRPQVPARLPSVLIPLKTNLDTSIRRHPKTPTSLPEVRAANRLYCNVTPFQAKALTLTLSIACSTATIKLWRSPTQAHSGLSARP